MGTNVEIQVWRLSVLFLMGTAVCVFFHVYTAFRGAFQPPKICLHMMDVLFSFAMLTISSAVLLLVNRGELRAYVLISMSSGFIITNWLVGQAVYQAFYNQFRLLSKGLDWCGKTVIAPTSKGAVKLWTKAKSWLVPKPPDDHTIEPT